MSFEAVEQQPHFPAVEERVLDRWRARGVIIRALESGGDADTPMYVFYEGPPTANGKPGVHHVEARVFKDIFPRYRAMKGYEAPRKGGWDCHGIPVELSVEKELGFTRKQDIEDYGVAAFNAKCRESVLRYVGDWERLTERVGFWVDTDDAYRTMDASYIESVWWSLAELWKRGLIYEGYRVVPYCPRCGTALSDHEVAQGYAQAVDPSIYVRFPILEGDLHKAGASLLVWTTTPWTLISNTAAVVGPDIRYVLADADGDGPVVLAADLVSEALGEDARILRDVSAAELEGLHYQAPFDFLTPEQGQDWHYITVADFVTTEEGTGIVHIAPAFGEDDMAVARAHGLPMMNPVDAEGRFDARISPYAGQFVKDADERIITDLRAQGVLLRAGEYEHTYPFCWRCGTPLLYYAKPSWYIATTRIRDRLLAENAQVSWYPAHIRDGRYGDWLANNVDWALSRERYWGTPLPLWRCEQCGEVTAVGSVAELSERAGEDLSQLDPHRPFVDEVTFACPACEGTAQRVPEVIDAWYDSGAMPFAQFGYPHLEGSAEHFKALFPADFISEAVDQTRGWFYSLMAVSTLLFDRNSYRTVVCLGHIVDAEGRKMSKSLGNVIDPWSIIDKQGADALRWLMLTEGSPWVARRVGSEPVEDVVRRLLLTLWNTYYFFVTYARVDGWTPYDALAAPQRAQRPVLDRWILAELAETVAVVDEGLANYDTTAAGRRIQTFVDDLSNWYLRRSRRRFWSPGSVADGEASADKLAAYATLHQCLVTVCGLLAPFTPFVADELYENLVRSHDGDAPESVHLQPFPTVDESARDATLQAAMHAARTVVKLGRQARNEGQVAVRQPLRRALVGLPDDMRETWPQVADVVADELNVKDARLLTSTSQTTTVSVKPNFRALGPAFGARTPRVAAAINAAAAEDLVRTLRAEGRAQLEVEGEPVVVTDEQVQIFEEARTGWQVASDGGYSVALDLAVDAELRREGMARDLVRALNDLRKQHDLRLDERIELTVDAGDEVAAALRAHQESVAGDVLATSIELGPVDDGDEIAIGDHPARVLLRSASLDSSS